MLLFVIAISNISTSAIFKTRGVLLFITFTVISYSFILFIIVRILWSQNLVLFFFNMIFCWRYAKSFFKIKMICVRSKNAGNPKIFLDKILERNLR